MSTKGFVEKLQAQLASGLPKETAFDVPDEHGSPAPEVGGDPQTFFTPADAVLHPKATRRMIEARREAQRRLVVPTPRYRYAFDVFTVHRPVAACPDCKLNADYVYKQRRKALEEGGDSREVEPEYDFHTCPHNRRDEYLALMNRYNDEEVVIASHREETLQNGCVQISVRWGEPARREPGARDYGDPAPVPPPAPNQNADVPRQDPAAS